MIIKFKRFEQLEIDPYGEEIWNELTPIEDVNVGDDVFYIGHSPSWYMKKGKVLKIRTSENGMKLAHVYYYETGGTCWHPFYQLSHE